MKNINNLLKYLLKFIFYVFFSLITVFILISENNYLLDKSLKNLKDKYNMNFNYTSLSGGLLSGIEIKNLNYENDFSGNISMSISFLSLLNNELKINDLIITDLNILKTKKELETKYLTKNNQKTSNNSFFINSISINMLKIKSKKNDFIFNIDEKINISNIDIFLTNSFIDLNDILNSNINAQKFKIISNKFILISSFIYTKEYVDIRNVFEVNMDIINPYLKEYKLKINKDKILIKNHISKKDNILNGEIFIDEFMFTFDEIENKIKFNNNFNININNKKINSTNTINLENKFIKNSHNIEIDYLLNKELLSNNLFINSNHNIQFNNKEINTYLTRNIFKNNEEIKLKNMNFKIQGTLNQLKTNLNLNVNLKKDNLLLDLNSKNDVLLKNLEHVSILNNNQIDFLHNELNIINDIDFNLKDLNNSLYVDIKGNSSSKNLELDFKSIFNELEIPSNFQTKIENKFSGNLKNKELSLHIESNIKNKNEYLNLFPVVNTELFYNEKENFRVKSIVFDNSELKLKGIIDYFNNNIVVDFKINDVKTKNNELNEYIKKEMPLKLNAIYADNLKLKVDNRKSKIEILSEDLNIFNSLVDIQTNIKGDSNQDININLKGESKINLKNETLLSNYKLKFNEFLIMINNSIKDKYIKTNIFKDGFFNINNNFEINKNESVLNFDINLDDLKKEVNKIIKIEIPDINGDLKGNIKYFDNNLDSNLYGNIFLKELDLKDIKINSIYNIKERKGDFDNISFEIQNLNADDTVNNYINKNYKLEKGIYSIDDTLSTIKYNFLLNNNFDIDGFYKINKNELNFNFNIDKENILVNKYVKTNFSANGNMKIKNFIDFNLNSDIDINSCNVIYDLSNLTIDTDSDIVIIKNEEDRKRYLEKETEKNIWIDDFYMKLNLSNKKPIIFKNKEIDISSDSSFEIIKEKKKEIALNGSLMNIDGKYIFLGKTFNIINSKIFFNTSLEPLIDLKLEYKKDDIVIFINISGDLHNPIVKLTSNPIMEETDIYSYLLFNKSSLEITDSDKEKNSENFDLSLLLLTNTFTEEVADSLGIDNIKVYMKSDQIGYEIKKSINKRLTVIYNQDTEENKIKIEYKFNNNLGIESVFSERNELNLFYQKKYK